MKAHGSAFSKDAMMATSDDLFKSTMHGATTNASDDLFDTAHPSISK